MKKINNIFTEPVRAYIYRVLVAVGVLLAGFGYLTGEQLAQIMGVVIAVLNIMPTANTSTKSSAPVDYIPDTQGK